MNAHHSPKTILVLFVVNFILNECVFRDFGIFPCSTARPVPSFHWFWCNLIVRLFAIGSLCMIWRHKILENSALTAAEHTERPLAFVYALFPVLMNLILSVFILAEFTSGSYSSPGVVFQYSPAYFAQCGLQVYPLLTFFLLRDIQLAAVLLSWFIALVTLFVCCIYTQSIGSFVPLMAYVVISVTIFYEHYRQNKALSVARRTLDVQLAENRRLTAHSQAMELRAMIGNVAHDLKTPLTSFLSGTEHMEDIVKSWETDLKADKKEVFMREAPQKLQALRTCLVNMNSTNCFMSMIINRCLDYTKSTKGFELVPKQDIVELRVKLLIPVQLIHDTHCYDNIQIIVAPINPIISPRVMTDRQWLIENLLCLLSNAAKFSRKGRVDLSVELVPNALHAVIENSDDTNQADAIPANVAAQCLRFEVIDSGVGMSDEAMEDLFNPFKQAERLAGGAGLGLFSLAKRVEAMHGQYGVTRRPDGEQGLLFWFTIPYHPVNGPASPAVKFSPTARNDSHSFNGSSVLVENHYRVMIVDDAPLVVKMVRLLLTGKGHQVVEKAVNGEEALEKLIHAYSTMDPFGQPPFDVVLMDLQMPVLDGIEAIRRLRAFEQTSQQQSIAVEGKEPSELSPEQDRPSPQPLAPIHTAPAVSPSKPFHQFVVAFSANSDHETKQAALEAGADGFLSKPFSYESFMEAMRGV